MTYKRLPVAQKTPIKYIGVKRMIILVLKVFRKIKATILINKVNLLSALINLKWLPVIWETLHSQLKMTYSTTTLNSRLLSCEKKIVFSLIEISSK